MSTMRQYLITGNTFDIKEELKAHACSPVYEDKRFKGWKTPMLSEDELSFIQLKSLTKSCEIRMTPIDLTPKQKIIQDILADESLWD